MWESNFNKRAIGVPGGHFRDLRHAQHSRLAAPGASLRGIMARVSHTAQALH